MKKLSTAITLTAVALVAAGCGGASLHGQSGSGGNSAGAIPVKNGPLNIAVVPKALGFDYWDTVHKGADCAASRSGGNVKIQWNGVTAETDVTGQVDLLQNYVTQGVDGLVYAATDAKVLSNVTSSAMQHSIPVVNIDSGTTPQPDNVPLFATDNVSAATKVPDLLAKALGPGTHKIAFIPFQPGTATNDQRTQGFMEGLKKYPDLQLVATQSSQSDSNTALSVTQNILTAHPDLDGIFAANEPGVLGASSALKQTGRGSKVVLVGWDAAPDELKALQAGEISGLVVQNPFRMGYDGVNAVVKELRTGKPGTKEDTGATFVTKDNINQPEVQQVLHPSCAAMPSPTP